MKKLIFLFNTIFLLCAVSLWAQTGQTSQAPLKGTVFSASTSEALFGVAVTVKGDKTVGTTTSAQGTFSLNVAHFPATVVFSLPGYAPKEVDLPQFQSTLNVNLEDISSNLDEVVIVGYGAVKKSDLTGSVASMKGTDVAAANTISFDEAMMGKIAGVNIVSNSGEPGAGLSINIRGIGSVNADTEPLYVIDGAPVLRDAGSYEGGFSMASGASVNPLSGLNPNDIQSIDILKDASATAIYGSRGSNGVVLITTKSGSVGAPKVTFDAHWGVNAVSKKIKVLSGTDFINAMANDFGVATYVSNYQSILQEPMHDWQNEILRVGPQKEYSVGVSGGTKQTTYSISAGYSNIDGLVRNSDYTRWTARARIDQDISKKVKAGVNILFSNFFQNGAVSGGGADTGADVFQQMLRYRPVHVQFNASTDLSTDTADPQSNPIDYVNEARISTGNTRTNVNTYVQYTIIPNLLFKSSFSYMITNTKNYQLFPKNLAAARAQNGRGMMGTADRSSWTWENIATYEVPMPKDHTLNVMGGYTMEKYMTNGFSQQYQDLPDQIENQGLADFSSANLILSPTISNTSYQLMSFLGRVNYSFKDRYLLTASIRADGSSKFPVNKKWGYYPSAAFAWKIDRESFLSHVREISQLKLRLSWGLTGNQSIPPYSSQALYTPLYYSFNTLTGTTYNPYNPTATLRYGLAQTSYSKPELTWEHTTQYNAGLDLGVLNNRISFTFDAYYKKTSDLLLNANLPPSYGYDNGTTNRGALENKGIEFSISSANITKKRFSWTTVFNISFNRNKVLDDGGMPMYFGNGQFPDAFVLQKGYPVGSIYGYHYTGVYTYSDYKNFYIDNDPSKGMRPKSEWYAIYHHIWVDNNQGEAQLLDGEATWAGNVPQIGFPKFQNVSPEAGTPNITPDDRRVIGKSDPDFYGGFTNKFTLGNFDLNIFMQFSYGNQFFCSTYGYTTGRGNTAAGGGGVGNNILYSVWNESWRPYRDSQAWPDMTNGNIFLLNSDLYVKDGSYLKFKNVTLGYTFSSKLMSKIGVKSLRLYASVQNLWTFTSFPWFDPETSNSQPLTAGMYNFKYPSSRTFLGGLSATF